LVMTVNGGLGQVPEGGFETPTKTMFHTDPDQFPQISFRESHCCCEMELTVVFTLESARKPPLEYCPSDRFKEPLTCTRRREVPCDTDQVIVLLLVVGTTARFSADIQKFWVESPPRL